MWAALQLSEVRHHHFNGLAHQDQVILNTSTAAVIKQELTWTMGNGTQEQSVQKKYQMPIYNTMISSELM